MLDQLERLLRLARPRVHQCERRQHVIALELTGLIVERFDRALRGQKRFVFAARECVKQRNVGVQLGASGDGDAPRYRRISGSGPVDAITARALEALA